MKITNYLFGLGMLLLVSCDKDLDVKKVPTFDVKTESTTFKVGQPVVFTITGEADIISFYSGQGYNNYAFKDGRVLDLETKGATLSFTSSVQLGAQANQLAVLASSDFNGNYSSLASIKAATWTDITSRFTLGSSTTFLASTNQNISDLIVPGKPVYIAFKYLTKPQATNGLARTWMIQGVALTSTSLFNGTNPVLSDQTYAGFRIVDEDPVNTPSRSLVTSTRVTLLGNVYKDPLDPIFNPNNPIYDPTNPIYNPLSPQYVPGSVRPVYVPYDPTSPYNDPTRETWAVSTALNTDKLDMGPDWSIPVRGIQNPKATVYSYTYTQPGTYKAYFVASNTTKDESKSVVKEVTVTIAP